MTSAEQWKIRAKWMVLGALILYFVAAMIGNFSERDNTDPPNGRSGLKIRTDTLTGCQYLETTGGGITPRLGSDGSHIGCKQ